METDLRRTLGLTTILAMGVLTQPVLAQGLRYPAHRHSSQNAARESSKAASGHRVPQTEKITVSAGIQSPNEVHNTTPGGGLMPVQTEAKTRSGVTRDFIAKQAPNATIQSLIASLPGVAYARADPYGMISRNLVIRGLNPTEIGYLVEGIPLTDAVYLTPDAIGSAPDMENVSNISLTQGSPDITAPVYNAVGSEISTTLRDPAATTHALIDSSYGTWNMKREFARFDTGEIGHSGVRAFASYSYEYNKFWQTPGSLTRHHVDAKVVKDWGDGNRAAISLMWGDYASSGITANGAATPTKASFEQHGTSSLYYPATYTPGFGNYYMLNRVRNDSLAIIAPLWFNLGHGLKLSLTPYYLDWQKWTDYGETISNTKSWYGTQPAGNLNLPGVVNGQAGVGAVDPQYQHNASLTGDLAWTSGNNVLHAGYWYSYVDMTERNDFSALGANGLPENAWGKYGITTSSGQILSGWNMVFRQQTNAIYLDDTYSMLGDRLKLNGGFKDVMLTRYVTNLIPGAADYKKGASYTEPLPQISLSYNITPNDQIYVDGTTSFKAPDRTESYVAIYDATTPIPIQTPPKNIKAEYAIGEEIGYRHNGLIHVAASLFNYNLTNHDVLSSAYIGGSLVTTPIDLGGETIRGAQVELALRPWHHFSPYFSGAFTHATLGNNFITPNNDLLPTKGKVVVNTPAYTAAIGLSYDDGTYFGNFNLNYIGKRYSTFMNDESVPGYITSDITLGYRFHNIKIANVTAYRPQFQLNLLNIGNNMYFAQATGLTSNAKTTRGIYGTTIAGKAPTYMMGGGFAIAGTVTLGF